MSNRTTEIYNNLLSISKDNNANNNEYYGSNKKFKKKLMDINPVRQILVFKKNKIKNIFYSPETKNEKNQVEEDKDDEYI